MPSNLLGKHFTSPKRFWTIQAKRANNHQAKKNLCGSNSHGSMRESTIKILFTSTKQGVWSQEMAVQEQQETMPLLAPVEEKLHTTDYQLHYLPTVSREDGEIHILLNTGLLARIEALESENRAEGKIAASYRCFIKFYCHQFHWQWWTD